MINFTTELTRSKAKYRKKMLRNWKAIEDRTLLNQIWVSLSFFWFHRERDTRPLCLCDDGGVWGLEIKQMEGEGEALDRRSKLGEWGLRSDRWRVRVRVRAWDRRWRVRVEIREMEGEGEAWDRRSKLGEWGLRLDRWRVMVRVRASDRRWRVRVEIGEMEGDQRSGS